ncbi:alpha-L-rhamnosidase [Pedobacter sp. PLR]|uniref:alpha-L-rhamnosidase-related protein n=1 Tax=Pedobacter sp. PLR TaxID=2994465 RepID=UPI002246B0BB|nr:alpha-L-rhamnosidase C-terminal domain-containing protein [Pedobacter sp. PLR]MCX2450157.1 alpha-L-rhamnosidase [Pedobacter sp. PLR]
MNHLSLRIAGYFFSIALLLMFITTASAQSLKVPSQLRVDLLLHADKVWKNGLLTNLSLQEAKDSGFSHQMALIANQKPTFAWLMNDVSADSHQIAYQILVASSVRKLDTDSGDVWDSKKVSGNQNTGVLYNGGKLDTNAVYYWKVKVWNNKGAESAFSAKGAFRTAKVLKDYQPPFYPITKAIQYPLITKQLADQNLFYDFEKDAFGQLNVLAIARTDHDTLRIHVGESVDAEGRVDRIPKGTIRYRLLVLPLKQGRHSYDLRFTANKQNTGAKAILMPDYIAEVLPFRYVEIEKPAGDVAVEQVFRYTVNYLFDDDAVRFKSSDTLLNQVWELSKYTIKATSFTGLYIDGDRERIPYEADALINQLSHYASDAEFNMAKRSLYYLIYNATWPTEWSLQNLLIAWNDYLYSGDIRTVKYLYPELKAKLLLKLGRPDGLISTRNGKQDTVFTNSIHFKRFNDNTVLKDIVDWPQKGGYGLDKDAAGETDGFVFTEYNSVVNAFHYQALLCMQELATVLNEGNDAAFFKAQAAKVKAAFKIAFIDRKTGLINDGEGTTHRSLHANMFALAFKLVPENNKPAVIAHIRSRGMACSVYGAQFLLDALYDVNEDQYALQLLTSVDKRSWYNMLRSGTTMTTEAWGTEYKKNQDWNHAWGAAPANIIVRKLMGVEPLTPSFATMQIKPQPGTLNYADLQFSTLRGKIEVSFNKKAQTFQLQVTLPPNSKGIIYLPRVTGNDKIIKNGKVMKAIPEGKFWKLINVSPGKHIWLVKSL